MNFSQFLLILKARAKIIIWTFLIIVGTTISISLVLPKNYTATTSLVVNYKGVDPLSGMVMQAQLMPGYMATQVDIITSHAVAVKVVQNLGLTNSPVIKQQFEEASEGSLNIEDWLADLLLKKLDVKPSRESSILEISYTGSDPQFSAAIANAFADAYQEASLRLKVEPSQKAAGYLLTQAKIYREKLEQAQIRLSQYQQENGLTSIAENLDVENAKLNQLANQLIMVQAQALDSSSRQKNANANGDASPDVAASPVIQNLKVALAQATSKLAEAGNRLGTNHPQYQAAQAEVDKLKSQLDIEVSRIGSSVGGSARIYSQNEALLKAALAAQKQKVLDLNRSRDQLIVLQRDVETAQTAYNNVTQRLNQTSIEGKANESDISILNVAIPPDKHSSPKLLLNTILSIFLGGMLGIAFALLSEMMNRKVRSTEDIIELVELPLLAMIESNTSKTKKSGLLPRFAKGY
ncbi:chain length determinant protein EpsF [Methylophilus sp. TWE2]|uniref:chain length determinant protein EpsF n=1 Tax=Methylophilus sp. TWE2 TaxID=1662285 RepID=UPI000670AB39|nr:chain length determinant protein EpsF [Methylophilus sp. TWE2]AKR43397.1 chain-length determining protein [Methylophilus sp. TWE2]